MSLVVLERMKHFQVKHRFKIQLHYLLAMGTWGEYVSIKKGYLYPLCKLSGRLREIACEILSIALIT